MQSNFLSSVGLLYFARPSLLIWAFGGLLSLFLAPVAPAVPTPESHKTLQIYFVDVEGGQATLFVTPKGQSCSLIRAGLATTAAMPIASLLRLDWPESARLITC